MSPVRGRRRWLSASAAAAASLQAGAARAPGWAAGALPASTGLRGVGTPRPARGRRAPGTSGRGGEGAGGRA